MGIARLEEPQKQAIEQLEQELGTPVMAVEQSCHWTGLNQEQLSRLQQAEKQLGITLLAYESE
jgi:maleate cis-trans isomerase